jgi:hypothetical protein
MTDVILVREVEFKVISEVMQGPTGPQGPQGTPGEGTGLASRVNFSWGDASPTILYTLITGKTLLKIEIYITTPFDGTSPFITIGKAGNTNQFFGIENIDIKTIGQYQTNPLFSAVSDTIINLYLSPDFDTNNGGGFILLYTS